MCVWARGPKKARFACPVGPHARPCSNLRSPRRSCAAAARWPEAAGLLESAGSARLDCRDLCEHVLGAAAHSESQCQAARCSSLQLYRFHAGMPALTAEQPCGDRHCEAGQLCKAAQESKPRAGLRTPHIAGVAWLRGPISDSLDDGIVPIPRAGAMHDPCAARECTPSTPY